MVGEFQPSEPERDPRQTNIPLQIYGHFELGDNQFSFPVDGPEQAPDVVTADILSRTIEFELLQRQKPPERNKLQTGLTFISEFLTGDPTHLSKRQKIIAENQRRLTRVSILRDELRRISVGD